MEELQMFVFGRAWVREEETAETLAQG